MTGLAPGPAHLRHILKNSAHLVYVYVYVCTTPPILVIYVEGGFRNSIVDLVELDLYPLLEKLIEEVETSIFLEPSQKQ